MKKKSLSQMEIDLNKAMKEANSDGIDFEPNHVLLWRIIDAIIIEGANPTILDQQQHYIREQAIELIKHHQDEIFRNESNRLGFKK